MLRIPETLPQQAFGFRKIPGIHRDFAKNHEYAGIYERIAVPVSDFHSVHGIFPGIGIIPLDKEHHRHHHIGRTHHIGIFRIVLAYAYRLTRISQTGSVPAEKIYHAYIEKCSASIHRIPAVAVIVQRLGKMNQGRWIIETRLNIV